MKKEKCLSFIIIILVISLVWTGVSKSLAIYRESNDGTADLNLADWSVTLDGSSDQTSDEQLIADFRSAVIENN